MSEWFQGLKAWQQALVAEELLAFGGVIVFLVYNAFTGNWALMPNAVIVLIWFAVLFVLDRIATTGFLDENPHLRKHIDTSLWRNASLVTMQEVLLWRGIKWLMLRIRTRGPHKS